MTDTARTGTLFSKVAMLLTGSMVLSGVGTLIGMPMASLGFMIVTMIAFLGLSIAVAIAAKTASPPVAVGLLGVFSFVAGLFIGPTIGMYVQQIGAGTVALAYLGTGGIMAICGLVASVSGINFRKMEGFLLIGLFGMIIVGLIACFTGMTVAFDFVYSLIGVALFTGFFLVDFYRLATSNDDSWGEAVSITAQLFLDFLNMLLYVLRLLAILTGKKDD